MLGHWERVFAAPSIGPVGATFPVTLLVPSPFPRFDYHLPLRAPRPVEPVERTSRITLEAKESIDLFGARVPAFRCRVEPQGLTLWVSPNGGVLRFEDGRGLVGALEP